MPDTDLYTDTDTYTYRYGWTQFIRQLHPNNMLAKVPGYNFYSSTLGWPLFVNQN